MLLKWCSYIKNMNISIIIPCYNSAQYIQKCIYSLLDQNYDKSLYEIIVILDSCTDDSQVIVEECLKNFPNRKLLSVNCRRPGLARNAGLNIAVGKYVWFIDSDDYLTDNSAFAQLTRIIDASRRKAIYMTSFESERHINERFAIWRYFYNREFLGTERFTDVPIDEDWEFTRRIMRKPGYSEMRLDNTMYHHTFPRDGSVVTEFFRANKSNLKKPEAF